MSHSTEIKIQIGGFSHDIDLNLQYGSRQPAEAVSVGTNSSNTFNNELGLAILEKLLPHGYSMILSGCIASAKNWQEILEHETGIDWLTVTVSHYN